MADIPFIVTDAGRAALVAAGTAGTLPIKIASLGISATASSPTATATTLNGEFKRIAGVAGDAVDAATIHLVAEDDSADQYEVRGLALYLTDGTLFAIYSQAGLIMSKAASAIFLLAADIRFASIPSASIAFGSTSFLNPPATTERQGVVELATVAEATAGVDAVRALTAASASSSVMAWVLARDGAGSALDADLLDGLHAGAFGQLAAVNTWAQQQTFDRASVHNSGGRFLSPNNLSGAVDIVARTSDEVGLIRFTNSAFNAVYGNLTVNSAKQLFWDGQMFIAGNKAWHAGNDGAGSGLDADMVRGYTIGTSGNSIPTLNLGNTWGPLQSFPGGVSMSTMYFPAQGTAEVAIYKDNAAGTLAISTNRQVSGSERYFVFGADGNLRRGSGETFWHSGIDGSGSGLDADLLDGQDGSFYSNIPARLGYTPLNKGGDSVYGEVSYIAPSGDNAALAQRGSTTLTPLQVRGNGNGAAVMTFHRPGSYATYFGLDVDNKFKFGAWSAGAVAYEFWHTGNDGAGSGLDADVLDGLQATEFLRATANAWTSSTDGQGRFFFAPNGATFVRIVNAVQFQNTSNVNVLTVDEGGGLYANGEVQGLRFRAASNGDGYAYAVGDDAWIGDTNLGNTITVRGQQNGNAGYISFGTIGLQLGNNAGDATLRWGGNPVWHAANDGSGSGLDADTVDGWHASGFIPTGNLAATGWCRLPNGLIMQWGRVSVGANAYATITFPIAFSSACFYIGSGCATEIGNGNAQANGPLPYGTPTTQTATIFNAAPAANGWWLAIGA